MEAQPHARVDGDAGRAISVEGNQVPQDHKSTNRLATGTWPVLSALSSCLSMPPGATANHRVNRTWQALPTEPFRGMQDDIHSINGVDDRCVNSQGKICKTSDGGQQWKLLLTKSLAQRTVVYAALRVGGPAVLLRSLDGESNWVQAPLPASVGMVQDLNFFDASKGLLFAGTERLRALILLTQYGGVTSREVYRSTRLFELM